MIAESYSRVKTISCNYAICYNSSVFKLYNFLSRKIEEFKSTEKTVGLYTCGPTVYDYVHIGNWRTFIFEDILKRVLVFNGYKVKHVMNLTDIDDKIIKGARDKGIAISKLTKKYTDAFFGDLEKLNILKADEYPRATEHITPIIRIIEVLVEKGFAYEKAGSIYFSISKFKDYGKLSGANVKGVKAGARVDVDEYDKENPSDFALWKKESTDAKERGEAFDSPWGVGRPGWHIECSAMSLKYLGELFDPFDKLRVNGRQSRTIDIHSGGVDLLFPHHENEIAQSEAATGKKFVNFWLEGEHLLVKGEKMAKRRKNIFTLEDIEKKGLEPLALRYLFFTAHYRSKLNFTWESLQASQNSLNNLRREVSMWDAPKVGCAEYESDFKKAINSDLDIPKAVSLMRKMAKSDYPTHAKHQTLLKMDEVLGLGIASVKKAALPRGARELIGEREEMRKSGRFKEADGIRQRLIKMGVTIEDTKEGSIWKQAHSTNSVRAK